MQLCFVCNIFTTGGKWCWWHLASELWTGLSTSRTIFEHSNHWTFSGSVLTIQGSPCREWQNSYIWTQPREQFWLETFAQGHFNMSGVEAWDQSNNLSSLYRWATAASGHKTIFANENDLSVCICLFTFLGVPIYSTLVVRTADFTSGRCWTFS